VAKKGGLSAGDVAALYKHKNAVVDVKVDTESNVASCLFSFCSVFLKKN
jgi:voltage-dependent anion channel protein 2